MVKAEQELSAAAARQMALRAQRLWKAPTPANAGSIAGLVTDLGAVQLDTISVLARSHELVARSRLNGMNRQQIEAGYWSEPATHFEYWSHAACILPISDWPLYEFRRQSYRDRGQRWHEVSAKHVKAIKQRLESEGPGTAQDFGGARKGAYWWNWSDTKVALEWLLDIGEVACTRRVAWRRVYDLTERVVPSAHMQPLPVDEAISQLLAKALGALGVATKKDLLDYQRLVSNRPGVAAGWQRFLDSRSAIPVKVQGWNEPAFADASALSAIDRCRSNTAVLLSPFDSLIWFRERMERLFGMRHRMESYTKSVDRVYGYFAMPVLAGDRLIGRVDPGKQKGAFLAKHIVLESERPTQNELVATAKAIQVAAGWIGADKIEMGSVLPASAKRGLTQLL